MEREGEARRSSTAPPSHAPAPGLGPLQEAAEAIVAKCEAELAQDPPPQRTARLHYEMAQAFEGVLADFPAASNHYQLAFAEAPDHVPTIRGARRMLIELGRFADALPFYDAELRVTADPGVRALLQYQRGRFLEEALGDDGGARAAYADALELDPTNPTILKAVERCDRGAREWRSLAEVFERAADAVKEDPRHRAALVVKRAQLLENELADPLAAAELYALALQLDRGAAGALEALVRLSADQRDWNQLIVLLGRVAERSDDARDRAMVLYRMGRLLADRLGDGQQAISALAAAIACAPGEPLVLEELTRLYGEAGDHEALAATLREMVEVSAEVGDRMALLHSLGEVYERRLDREEEAVRCYRAALALDPNHVPLLQALGKLLVKRGDWLGLVDMHLAEAAASASSTRRAAAHARAAELYETRLDRPSDAAVHHARALALVPGYPASFKGLARLYSQEGKHRELIELYERAVDEATVLERKVAYLFKVGALWEDALEDAIPAAHAYRRILKLQHDNLGALHALQRVTEKAERYDELVECLEQEAAIASETELMVGLLHRAGTILDERIGDAGGAKQRLQKALDIDPSFVPALASLGRIYYRAGHWDDLLEMYRRELAATPEDGARVALLTKMGELCERQRGKPQEAIDHYREAVEIAPGYRPAVRALGHLLREAGEYEELARLLERQAPELEDAAARALTFYRIGELYEERLDGRAGAIEFYRKALGEVPDHRPAAAALERQLEAAGEWSQLVEHLGRAGEAASDPRQKAALLLRQGEIWRDHLDDQARAIERFEGALMHERSLAALLALETLYTQVGDWPALAGVYARLAEVLADPAARLSAWRELARVQEIKGVGEPADRAHTYEAILAMAPNDAEALAGLADVARRMSDSPMLARIYARLGEAEVDEGVAAQHWLRLGHVLEATGAAGALEAYRSALRRAPDSLSALRGLGRTAEASGDAEALVEAVRGEAALANDPATAAELLVRSATLCLERRNDTDGAVEDLERALETWPDNGDAPELLVPLLVAADHTDRLAEVLSRAADSARLPERQAALWLAVAGVYADRKRNLGAAVAALKRALKVDPAHADAHRALARLYLQNAQWPEAIAAFESLIRLEIDPTERTELQLEVAALQDERLGNPDKARALLSGVLAVAPGHAKALARLAKLQLRAGELEAADTTVNQLLDHAADDADRARGLVLRALLAWERRDAAGAERALCEAVSIEGPAGEAAVAFHKIAAGGAPWVGYAAALDAHIQRGGPRERKVTAYLALAATCADRMALPLKALEVLHQGLIATAGDGRLAQDLITRAGLAGQTEEATRVLRTLLQRHEREPELWRAACRAFREAGRTMDARLAASAVLALGAATGEERSLLRQWPPRPGKAAAGSLGSAELASLSVDGVLAGPAAAVVAACAESLAKVTPTDLAPYGLSRKERLAPGAKHPLREQLDRLSSVVGFECDLYLHPGAAPAVTVGLTEPACLIVSARLGALPEAQQVFLLTRALVALALGLHPVLLLTAAELRRLLDAGTRAIVSDFGQDDPDTDELAHRIRKTISRRWRKALEAAAPALAEAPVTSAQAWRQAVLRSLGRAAALLADDLPAAFAALSLVADVGRTPPQAGLPPDEASDLLRFWMSEPATRLRARALMV
jgi:tetratricopeptide (TPR) repeat protein